MLCVAFFCGCIDWGARQVLLFKRLSSQIDKIRGVINQIILDDATLI